MILISKSEVIYHFKRGSGDSYAIFYFLAIKSDIRITRPHYKNKNHFFQQTPWCFDKTHTCIDDSTAAYPF